MAAMTLQEIRDFVRTSLDVDDEELTDALLDVYIREGSNLVLRASRVYSFYEVEYTISSVPDQQAYVVANETSNTTGITLPLQSIVDVRAPTYTLRAVSHTAARRYYRTTQASTGNPYRWSMAGDSIYLWPVPSDAVQLNIHGFRHPQDWMAQGAGGTPDAPQQFHEIIAYWALHRGYLQQDDIEMAQIYATTFQGSLKAAANQYTHGNDAGPLILNSGLGFESTATDSLRNWYDWE